MDRRPAPLRRALSARFAAVALLPLLLVGALLFYGVLPKLHESIASKNRAIANLLGEQALSLLAAPAETIESLAKLSDEMPLDPDKFQKVLDNTVASSKLFETLYVLDASGQVVGVGLPEHRQLQREDYLGLDLSPRRFVSDAREQRRTSWSDSFLSLISGEVAVGLAYPGKSHIVVGEIRLRRLAELVSRLAIEEDMMIAILDQRGYVVAHRDPTLAIQHVGWGHLPIVRDALEGRSHHGRFELEGIAYVGSAKHLAEMKWGVLVAQPLGSAFRHLTFAGYVLLAGALLAVLVAIGVGLLLARRLAQPVEKFAARANQVATGDYTNEAVSSGLKELEELDRSLRRMALAVREREQRVLAAEIQYRGVVESTTDPIVRLDSSGALSFANHAAASLFGLPPPVCAGQPLIEFIHPEDRAAASARLAQILTHGMEHGALECRIDSPGAGCRHLTWSFSLIEEGDTRELTGVARDVTDRLIAEERQRLAAKVYESSTEGMVVTDESGRIVSVNPAFTRITGYTEAEVLGQTPLLLRSERQNRTFYTRIWRAVEKDGRWQGEVWSRRRNGEEFPESLTISAVAGSTGAVTHYVLVFSDVSDLKRSEERLDFLAHHDALTQLPNRRLFSDRLSHSISRSHREKNRFALLFMDLDNFKKINDTLGHAAGDELLLEVTRRIRPLVREGDTFARLGGDEFVLIIEGMESAVSAGIVAQKILDALAAPVLLGKREVFPGASVGIAVYPDDGLDSHALLKNADTAMYEAKKHERGGYRFYREEMTRNAGEVLRLESLLRRSIERQELRLHYQPQVDLATGRLVGVEALVRWQSGEVGFVMPDQFISLAEECGFIVPLGEWVLLEACRQMRAWIDRGFAVPAIAVNVSVKQLERGDFARSVRNVLEQTGLSPEKLELEITESALMESSFAKERVMDLHEIGVQLSVDDFGTGYSSLTYLKRLPVQRLKIDRSFVRDIPHDKNDEAIVQAIIRMAKSLGLGVVAEGVETEEQACFLRDQECALAQGYLYSRPVPAQELLANWRERVALPLAETCDP